MSIRATRSKRTITRTKKRWKVPFPIKVGIAMLGTFFILVAIAGSLVHSQTNMTLGANGTAAITGATNATGPASQADQKSDLQAAKGCIGNDQTTGKTYLDVRCVSN
jgi:hypothetical protein